MFGIDNKVVVAALILASSASQVNAAGSEVICAYAPSQSAVVNRISGLISGAAGGTEITLVANGMQIVAHSSGGSILTGSGGYIAGTMTGATVATTMVTLGILVSGVVVTVELACAPKNHPELVKQVMDGAAEYQSSGKTVLDNTLNSLKKFKIEAEDKYYELIGESWYERAIRRSKRALGIS